MKQQHISIDEMRAWVGASLLIISNGILSSYANEPSPVGRPDVDEQSDPTRARRHQLSIDDVTSLLVTEAHNQFATHRLLKEDSEKSWNSAIESEWSRARELEERAAQNNGGALRRTTMASGTFPYLVCDVEPGKLGERCRAAVEEHFGSQLMVSGDLVVAKWILDRRLTHKQCMALRLSRSFMCNHQQYSQ